MRLRLVRRGPAAAALALLTLLYATVHSCAASAVVAQALRAARLARTAHPPALTHTADAARVVWDEGGDPVPLLPALGFQLNDATAVFKVAVGFDGVDRPDEDLAVLVPPPAVPRGFVSVHRAVLNGRPVVVFTAGLRGVRYTRHIVAALRAVHVDFSKAQQARGKRRVFVSVTTDVGVVQSLDVPWYKGVVAVVRHASTPMVSPTSATARVGERAGPFTVIPSSSDDPGETTHVIVTHTSQGASVIDAATGLVVPTGSALPCDVEHAAQVYLAPPPGRQCFSAVACFAASDDGARPSQASRVVNVSSVWLPPPFYGVPDVNFQPPPINPAGATTATPTWALIDPSRPPPPPPSSSLRWWPGSFAAAITPLAAATPSFPAHAPIQDVAMPVPANWLLADLGMYTWRFPVEGHSPITLVNPSVAKFGGRWYAAVRNSVVYRTRQLPSTFQVWHQPVPRAAKQRSVLWLSKMFLVQLDDNLQFAPSAPPQRIDDALRGMTPCLLPQAHGWEDGRLVVHLNQLYVVFNNAPLAASRGQPCAHDHLRRQYLMQLGTAPGREVADARPAVMMDAVNVTTGAVLSGDAEKNWAPFSRHGTLWMVTSVLPQVVCAVDVTTGRCAVLYQPPTPAWVTTSRTLLRHPLRGGSPPVLVPAAASPHGLLPYMLHVTHTRQKQLYTHYFVAFSAEPPFTLLAVSRAVPFVVDRRPIDYDVPKFINRGDRVAFAAGLAVVDGIVVVTYGSGDHTSRQLRMPLAAVEATMPQLVQRHVQARDPPPPPPSCPPGAFLTPAARSARHAHLQRLQAVAAPIGQCTRSAPMQRAANASAAGGVARLRGGVVVVAAVGASTRLRWEWECGGAPAPPDSASWFATRDPLTRFATAVATRARLHSATASVVGDVAALVRVMAQAVACSVPGYDDLRPQVQALPPGFHPHELAYHDGAACPQLTRPAGGRVPAAVQRVLTEIHNQPDVVRTLCKAYAEDFACFGHVVPMQCQ